VVLLDEAMVGGVERERDKREAYKKRGRGNAGGGKSLKTDSGAQREAAQKRKGRELERRSDTMGRWFLFRRSEGDWGQSALKKRPLLEGTHSPACGMTGGRKGSMKRKSAD